MLMASDLVGGEAWKQLNPVCGGAKNKALSKTPVFFFLEQPLSLGQKNMCVSGFSSEKSRYGRST